MKKMRRRKYQRGQGGQALLEFLIVTSMILTFTFIFVQLAWGIAYAHYVHYATYMASRAYLSGGATIGDQADSAAEVLRTMLKRPSGKDLFPFIAKARTGDDRDAKGAEPVPGGAIGFHSEASGDAKSKSRAFSWAEGVQYNFNLKLFLLPISTFIVKDGQGKTITPGSPGAPAKSVEWKGAIPFTSDSFLGRDPNHGDCLKFMVRMSAEFGIGRGDQKDFIEDNGC
ncbi:MAG: pilus assembly protein [Proteobacteria bacterium]|nr:MAG: pilus assembly protein [Pseudomonadota bacterium]